MAITKRKTEKGRVKVGCAECRVAMLQKKHILTLVCGFDIQGENVCLIVQREQGLNGMKSGLKLDVHVCQ
jgi:hypothetical protein